MKVIFGGDQIDLGTVETSPTIGMIDYSRRVTDDFGVTTVVPRGFSRTLSARLKVPFDEVDSLQQTLADLRATPAQWVADETVSWLNFSGFYKTFDIDLNVPPISFCSLTVEGLAETEAASDPGGDPAPDGSTSTLRLLQPTTITNAVLASSTVPEYEYAEWASGTAYAADARVIRAHRIYESLTASNVGKDPAATVGFWLDIGPTDRWAMFDGALGTRTTSATSIVVALNATGENALALLDVDGATVRVQATGYDQTAAVDGGAIAFLDMPNTNGLITVTIAGTGMKAVGTLLMGRVVSLGITEASPTAGITDFSRKETDDFGEPVIVERAWAKRMSAQALIRTNAIDLVADRIAAVRTVPSLWIGDAGLDSLTIYGFFKDFRIEVGENVSKLSLSIEGLSEAAPLTSPVLSVDWTDITDNTGTKPEDNAHKGAPAGSNVGGVKQPDGTYYGGKPAEEVAQGIDQNLYNITDILVQVSDLEEIYGETLTAIEAADISRIASENGQFALQLTQAARDAAQDAKTAAAAAAAEAAVRVGDAQSWAQTAEGHVILAAQHADEAGAHASIAEGHVLTASTKAGEAEVARQAAAVSEQHADEHRASALIASQASAQSRNQAGDFAQAASEHEQAAGTKANEAGAYAAASEAWAVRAESSIGAELSNRASEVSEYYLGGPDSGPPDSKTPLTTSPSISLVSDPDEALVLQLGAGVNRDIAQRGWLPFSEGQTIRVVMRGKALGGGTQPMSLRLFLMDDDGDFLDTVQAGITLTAGWATYTADFTSAQIRAANLATRWVRAGFWNNGGAATQMLAVFGARNVTSEAVTAAHAAAAALSATTATTKAELSGAHAIASEQHKLSAEAAVDLADTRAQASSDAATIAEAKASEAGGHALAASSFRLGAETFYELADQRAQAASESATLAQTRSDEAGNHAVAASNHKQAAEVQAGLALNRAEAADGFRAQASDHAAAAFQHYQLTAEIAGGDSATVAEHSATLTEHAGVLATVQGRTQTFWNLVGNAGDETAFAQMFVETSPGVFTSNFDIGARRIRLFNTVTGGLVEAMRVEGNVVRANNLIVGTGNFENLSVGTEKITGNAVTFTVSAEAGGNTVVNPGQQGYLPVDITYNKVWPNSVLRFEINIPVEASNDANYAIRLISSDGTYNRGFEYRMRGSFGVYFTASGATMFPNLSTGSRTWRLRLENNSNGPAEVLAGAQMIIREEKK